MSTSARVFAPDVPLYQLGARPQPILVRQRRPSQVTYAPRTPLYQLGWAELNGLGVDAAKVVAASAPIASVATTAAITAAAAGSGAAYGSWAGPIGAVVGAVVGLIAGLLAGHEMRAKQARNENSATNLGVSGFDSDLKKIQQSYRAGQIDANGVLQAAPVALQGYFTVVTPHIQPGRNGCQGGAMCPSPVKCSGDIGAACCIGCGQLAPGIFGPSGILAAVQGQSQSTNGPYVAEILQVYGSSYGASARSPYTLDFTPVASSATRAMSSFTSAIGVTGGGSSLLPLLLIAGGLLYMGTR